MVSFSLIGKFLTLCAISYVSADETVEADARGSTGSRKSRRPFDEDRPKEPEDPLKNVIDADMLVKAAKKYSPIVNYEKRLKDLAKYYSYFTHEIDEATNMKKELLCSSMVALNSESVDDLIRNVISSDNKCDWLFMVYKVDPEQKDALEATFNTKLKSALALLKSKQAADEKPIEVNLEFAVKRSELLTSIAPLCEQYVRRDIHNINNQTHAEHIASNQLTIKDVEWLIKYNPCDFSAFPLMHAPAEGESHPEVPYNPKIYPKILMFFHYLKYAQKYNFIWALDGDLSLAGMDMDEYMRTVKCTFKHTPIVSQPTIAENTQKYQYLNSIGWGFINEKEEEQHGRVVRASVSGFIEIQAPMFNALFLEFYIMGVILPMTQPTHILGADWGYDELFCKIAKYWAKSALKSPYVPGSIDSQIPCAVIVSSPINHKDSNEIGETVGMSNKFAVNTALVQLMSAAFSSYTQGGNAQVSNPTENKELLRVYDVQEDCPW